MEKSNKREYNPIGSISDAEGEHLVTLFSKTTKTENHKEWMYHQYVGDVKLLTLDGSYGGRNGMKYSYLSADLKSCDDWHIGRTYDEQGNIRYKIVIFDGENGMPFIRFAEDGELQNAYLIVSKRTLREKSKNLKRAKTSELKELADKMVDKFISTFNNISNGNVYSFQFIKKIDGNPQIIQVNDVYGRIYDKEEFDRMVNETLSNLPIVDDKFGELAHNFM